MNNYIAPQFDSIALVTIDMQVDFLKGQPCEIPGTSEILPALAATVQALRRLRLPIFHVIRLYEADGSNAELCRRERIADGASIVRPNSRGSELTAELLPDTAQRLNPQLLLAGTPQQLGENEWAVYKPRWGAFYRTPLERLLIASGVTTLAFGGCNFPNCPRTSIYEASERDFRLVLVQDAISGIYDRGRQEMADIGVTLLNHTQLTKALEDTKSPLVL